ncbi:hypothetical protein ACRQ5Q_09570 [Bradyrhizobium sp. PMVTL-01]|uniref:hypothetical protein n=1 Tax=Bradyrhizobium sp. PMVTL-01 TaxID=3434999 RepID=UPI003F6F8B3D
MSECPDDPEYYRENHGSAEIAANMLATYMLELGQIFCVTALIGLAQPLTYFEQRAVLWFEVDCH